MSVGASDFCEKIPSPLDLRIVSRFMLIVE